MEKIGQGGVRIIAGTLKGSKLPVLNLPGLRPSSDRVRETVFNWLQHIVPGLRVLDVFAGSGALGLEAVSRGAKTVILLEQNPQAAAQLAANISRLNIDRCRVIQCDGLEWLRHNANQNIDLVFLDPPFSSDYWTQLWPLLDAVLSDSPYVYIEYAHNKALAWPEQIRILKQGKTKYSQFFLAQWQKTVHR